MPHGNDLALDLARVKISMGTELQMRLEICISENPHQIQNKLELNY